LMAAFLPTPTRIRIQYWPGQADGTPNALTHHRRGSGSSGCTACWPTSPRR
jgi:hypothetical protein